jgi:hypothetical protein
MIKNTRVRVEWMSPSVAAAGPCATLSSTTDAMRNVTTLRGAYISAARVPSSTEVNGTKIALRSPARIP